MSSGFPMVPLEQVLKHRSEFIEIDDFQTYKRCRVQSRAQGIVERDIIPGAEIKTKRQQVCYANEFLVAEIDAKVGGFGIVPSKLDGAIVSSHYFLFTIDDKQLESRFLEFYARTPYFMEQVLAKGSTNYAAIRPNDVLSYEIPLPPLEEQRRIVARIEELAAKIEEARGLRREAVEEINYLLATFMSQKFSKEKLSNWREKQLGDYIIDDCYGTSEKTMDDSDGTPILRMGNIQNGRIDTTELKYLYLDDREKDKLLLKKGDIVVNRTNSAELVGKCAVFELEGDYGFASYLIRLRIDQTKANPWLVAAYINSPLGREYMFRERTQMTGQANVNAKKIKALPIILPSLPEQQQIIEDINYLQAKVDTLKRHQAATATELDALLPSILDKAFKGEL